MVNKLFLTAFDFYVSVLVTIDLNGSGFNFSQKILFKSVSIQ